MAMVATIWQRRRREAAAAAEAANAAAAAMTAQARPQTSIGDGTDRRSSRPSASPSCASVTSTKSTATAQAKSTKKHHITNTSDHLLPPSYNKSLEFTRDGLPGTSQGTASFSTSELLECPVCFQNLPIDVFPTLDSGNQYDSQESISGDDGSDRIPGGLCGHYACYDCLLQYLFTEISESRVKLTCPQCIEPLHPNDVQMLLNNDPKLLAKYERFSIRRLLMQDPDSRWCPAPDCDYVVIAQGCASCPEIKCLRPGCNTAFCYHCKQEWHPNQTCDAARVQRGTMSAASAYHRSGTQLGSRGRRGHLPGSDVDGVIGDVIVPIPDTDGTGGTGSNVTAGGPSRGASAAHRGLSAFINFNRSGASGSGTSIGGGGGATGVSSARSKTDELINKALDRVRQGDSELKPCPCCQVLILKMDDGSCNHMTCSICGTEFCWLCMKEVSDLHYLSPSGCTFWGKKPWSRKKKIMWQLGMLVGAPVGIALIAGIAVPAIIIGFPVWVGRKLHARFEKKMSLARHRRSLLIASGVLGSMIVSPVLAAVAVGIGVPILLAYVYGVVPISLCRSGGCGVVTSASGVRFEFDEENGNGEGIQPLPPTSQIAMTTGSRNNNLSSTSPPPVPDRLSVDTGLSQKLGGAGGLNPSIGEVSIGLMSTSMSIGSNSPPPTSGGSSYRAGCHGGRRLTTALSGHSVSETTQSQVNNNNNYNHHLLAATSASAMGVPLGTLSYAGGDGMEHIDHERISQMSDTASASNAALAGSLGSTSVAPSDHISGHSPSLSRHQRQHQQEQPRDSTTSASSAIPPTPSGGHPKAPPVSTASIVRTPSSSSTSSSSSVSCPSCGSSDSASRK